MLCDNLGMASYFGSCLHALQQLGRKVDIGNVGAYVDRGFMVKIDGHLRSEAEVYAEFADPNAADTYIYVNQDGTICGKLRIEWGQQGPAFRLAQGELPIVDGMVPCSGTPAYLQAVKQELGAAKVKRVDNWTWNFGIV